jgi:hypothetical protein
LIGFRDANIVALIAVFGYILDILIVAFA